MGKFTFNNKMSEEQHQQQQNMKQTRIRTGPTHRWSEKETSELLKNILIVLQKTNAGFEKPTSKVFYQKVAKCAPHLRNLTWHVMKSKMRHVQTSYKAALKWYNESGPTQLDYFENETDYINKICPNYHLLKKINEIINKPKSPQRIANEKTDKMFIKNSTEQFLIFDTAAIEPDPIAENLEMEFNDFDDNVIDDVDVDIDDNDDDDDDNDFNEDNMEESESYNSNDENAAAVVDGDRESIENENNLKFAEIKWEKQIKSLELEKEKLRIARATAETQKKTKQCNGPYHRWTDIQTEELLIGVYNKVGEDFDLFEKPISQVFYENIAENNPTLRGIRWQVMKAKMRHCRTMYLKAKSWHKNMGNLLIASGKEQEVKEYIQKLCPFWHIVKQIFGSIDEKNIPNSDDTELGSYEDDDISSKDDMLPLSSIDICKKEIIDEDDDDEQLIIDSNSAFSTNATNKITNDIVNNAVKVTENMKPLRQNTEENSTNVTNAKWDKLMELKILQLQVEKEKIQLERERTRNQLVIKKIELQHQLEIRKLELQHEERVTNAKQKLEMQKLEMQLRLNRRV